MANQASDAADETEIIRSLDGIGLLREFWTAHCSTVDADPECLQFLLQTDLPATRPYIVALRSDGETKAMLIGRVIKTRVPVKIGRRLIPVPNLRVILISHGGWLGEIDDARATQFTRTLQRSLADGEADAVLFHYLEPTSPLARQARQRPPFFCRDHLLTAQKNWVLEIPEDLKHFLSGLAKKNKRRGKLRRDFVEIDIKQYRTPDQIDELVAVAEAITSKSYQRRIGVGFRASDDMRSRLRFLANTGWLRGFILYLDGIPAAFWIGTQRRGVFTSDYLAFDPDLGDYAPGMYLIIECVGMLVRDEGSRLYRLDWGQGDQEYKQRLATHARDVAAIYIFAPRLLGIMVNLLRLTMGRINQIAKHELRTNAMLGKLARLKLKHGEPRRGSAPAVPRT
jgi:hypothetical protein